MTHELQCDRQDADHDDFERNDQRQHDRAKERVEERDEHDCPEDARDAVGAHAGDCPYGDRQRYVGDHGGHDQATDQRAAA
jgi:hypothetical protein